MYFVFIFFKCTLNVFTGKRTKKPPAPSVEFEIPYLGAEDVIDEVITLLAKLENDRRETKQNLKQEKNRVDMLSNKIDHVSEQRLQALPEAVQNGKRTYSLHNILCNLYMVILFQI